LERRAGCCGGMKKVATFIAMVKGRVVKSALVIVIRL
jgi:hypothetical protein